MLLLTACGGDSDGPFGKVGSKSDCDPLTDLCNAWLDNTTEKSAFLRDNRGALLVNVQSVKKTGNDIEIVSTGIPNYTVTVTQELIDTLVARPNAVNDFEGGLPNISVGQVLGFGEDIGFRNDAKKDSTCKVGSGYGFWPTSSGCPEKQAQAVYFPRSPKPDLSLDRCSVGEGRIGLWINGTSIFGWLTGKSYKDQNIWHELAPISEQYDLDICSGHALYGEYHHHAFSNCLARAANETEIGYSPIYGYVADGYPIYGPWVATGVLAKSTWVKRNYDDDNADSGCGRAGLRTCLLDDPLAVARKRTTISSAGPSTSDTVVVASENSFIAESGFYYEDYYWDESLSNLGGEYLDQHNGHSDPVRGYHYHLTVDSQGKAVFPYTVGPSFYGKLPARAASSCATTI
jgi:hypothetical protein